MSGFEGLLCVMSVCAWQPLLRPSVLLLGVPVAAAGRNCSHAYASYM